MTKRLEVLNNSLSKKQSELGLAFSTHFDDVKAANGQPLNDKRNGQATLNRWDRQSARIRRLTNEIEKTKNAIDREQSKINNVKEANKTLPAFILEMVKNGELIQWRKHANTFFIPGVEKARIVYCDNGKIASRYARDIPNEEQFQIFRGTVKKLIALSDADQTKKEEE